MKGIAVIIPVYNGAGMLSDCVESVKKAGDRITEIIIVDDGSKDSTLDVASKLSDSDERIRVIHTDNHGTYMARITGMRAATADYITSVDVDDRYCSGCLDMLAELMEEHDADAAMGGIVETESLKTEPQYNTSASPVIKVSTAKEMWPRIMKWRTQEFVCYNNKLYKRELALDLIEAEGICQAEDVLITCQIFLGVNRMVETTDPMYLYYNNPESLTRVNFGDHDLDVIRVWDKIVSIMEEKRPDLLPMARFNRWRTDFTMITRLILVDDRETDKKYAQDLQQWRTGLKRHWKGLIAPHAMPRNREILVIGLRFFYTPVKVLMRVGRKMTKKETSVILHSGDKR